MIFFANFKILNYENKNILKEYVTLRSELSGLPMDLWLDDNRLYEPHAPRIKFRASKDQRTTREFTSMLISNPNQIENMPNKHTIRTRDIMKLKEFVATNQELLLALANKDINYGEFIEQMIKV